MTPIRTAERCGVCRHSAEEHNSRGWCTDESCRCDKFIPWSSMRKNIPELPTLAQERAQEERVAGARSERLRRQLAAVVDSDLLVARVMAAASGDPMIASRVIEALLQAGLILIGPNPASFSQPTEQ